MSPINNIEVPNPKFKKHFAYYGRYYYIFFKAFNKQKFSFQLSFIFNNFNKIRFLFKYPLKKVKIYKTNTYYVEIPIEINEEKSSSWILYKFSPVDYINKNLIKVREFSSLKGITNEKCIFKSFEIFSTIHIRGIFISNMNFNFGNLPKEISLSGANSNLNMYFIDLVENKEERSKPNSIKGSHTNSQKGENDNENNNVNGNINGEFKDREENKSNDSNGTNNIYKNNYVYIDDENSKIDYNTSSITDSSNFSKIRRNNTKNHFGKSSFYNMGDKNREKDGIPRIPLYPDPILSLNHIIGYTSKNCPIVKYNSFGDYDSNPDINGEERINQTKKYFYYCSGPNIIKYDPYSRFQKFFMGHSKPVSHFIIGCKGEILFSGEEGVTSNIRIWNVENIQCIKMFTTPLDKLKSLSESINSKYLCAAGREQNKELIVIFKIEDLKNISIYVKKNSYFVLNSIKFVPYSDDILISCGNENIKFYRIKNSTIYEKAVVLSQYSKNNFLCIDFNRTIFGDNYFDKGKAYIGSSSGAVFQISCLSQELESVYLVQNSPIMSISSNEVFIVTGSEDGYCRVWPVGFEEFIMEARHDSSVCSVDISYDSLEVICGTLNGSIGVLNIKEKSYMTVFRSPNSDVIQLILHPSNIYILTLENNGKYNILRIWDLQHKDEVYEFESERDLISCITPNTSKHFVCGFNSGIIKVIDFEKNDLLYQCKPFKSRVDDLIFVQNYNKLVAMSAFGNLSVHDCKLNYTQIKIIRIEKQCFYTDISLSMDQNYFATIGPESKYVLTWNSESFARKNNINLNENNSKIVNLAKKLCLFNKNLLGVALESCSIRFYALGKYEGIFIREIKDMHIKGINKFICSRNYNYFLTSGEEGLIKIWDMKMIFNNYKSYQQYIGHASGVNGLAIIDTKGIVISTSKNSGIYLWNFLGDLTSFDRNILRSLEQLEDPLYINNLKNKLKSQITTTRSSKSIGKLTQRNFENKKEQLLTKDVRAMHMEKKYYAENPELKEFKNYAYTKRNSDLNKDNINNIISMESENTLYQDLEQEFKVLPNYSNESDDERIIINYSNKDYIINKKTLDKYEPSDIKINNIKHKFLFSSKFLPNLYNICRNKKNEKIDNENKEKDDNIYKLDLQYIVNLSINSMNNIVFNKEKNWYAYTANNKVIIEFLNSERKQTILSDSKDELSCLVLSKDLKYLISSIGQTNKEEYACIFIYDANSFSLIRKLKLHPKGVQYICLSNDNNYMVSLGTKRENSICLWNLNDFSVIDMKTVKFSPFTAVIENRIDTNSKINFITCSFDDITIWELNSSNKLENIVIRMNEILLNSDGNVDIAENEFITGVNICNNNDYEFYNKHICLLTNKGNIIVLDGVQKTFIKKYLISKYPLTKMIFTDSYFICGGEGPLLYIWNISENKSNFNLIQFLGNEKPNLIFFDGTINSIGVSSKANECILSTSRGSIFYVNIPKKNAIKILSSHVNTSIESIFTDITDVNVYTLGKEEYIRCWTTDSLDQKFYMKKKNQKPNNAIYGHLNNILLTQYENSYLTAFNTKNLTTIGKLYIPKEDISQFCFIFDEYNILLITFQINIYIISIKNILPLSMLYALVDIPKIKTFYPHTQKCTSLSCSNINLYRAYSSFSFSDGTTSVFLIEKVNGKVEYNLMDTFNIILVYSEVYNDENTNELYNNLVTFRSENKSASVFSKQFNEVILCYHELLQFILVRDFVKRENVRIIGINFFPYCLSINSSGKFIVIGTKEGILIFIPDGEKKYYYNYCEPSFYKGHYDTIQSLQFSHDSRLLFSASKNEIIVWNIKI